MLWPISFFKKCIHEYHHLVLILQDYLVTMWCVILMRNSNSKWPLIISSWILFASCWKQMYITLWGSNMLFVYYNPRKCEHMRYCHLELIFLIMLFLGGMFSQTSSTFIKEIFIVHLIGLCLSKKFLVRFSSNTYLYILFGKPFASSYSNHCCAWLCD